MEIKQPARKPRSFFRRFAAPVGLSVALLGGGVWGVYHTLANMPGSHKDLADAGKAHSASESAQAATDQLKNLFTSAPPNEEETAAKDLKPNRYSLAATEQTQPLTAAPELPPIVPKNTVGNRYGSFSQKPTVQNNLNTEPAREAAPSIDVEAATATNDVTRGQEPNVNPLRANKQVAELANNLDARAVFEEAPGLAPPETSNSYRAQQENANPFPPQNFPASGNARYQVEQPTNDFSSVEPNQQTSQPAASLEIESPLSTPPQVARANSIQTGLTPTPSITNPSGTGRPGEKMLEGVQSASISIQKIAPPEIQVGKRCTFAIRVRNTGQRTAQNVQVRDEIPLGTDLVGTAPHATVSGSQLIWDLGSLSVGEERLVEMELIPTEEREIGSVASVTLAAQASAKARCTRPELALRLTTKPQVLIGEQHLVQIEISNPGSGDADDVMLLETIPEGVSHEAGPALEFEIGTLRAGETRRMELILTAEQAGNITNVMTARANANLRVEATCEFEVLAPELQLSVEGPKRRYLERPATYQVSINNPGTATAKEIQLITKLPKGLQFVSADNLGEYDPTTHSVQWSLAELPANERGVVELTALPIEAGEQTLQITTVASQGLEDRAEKQVLVEGLTALSFEVTDVEGLIEVGSETTYDVVVSNQGSKTATNVQVVAIMPAGLRVISGQGSTQHTIKGDRIFFAPLPQLAPKAEATYRIQAQGTRPGDQRVRVMIQSDDLQQPITKEVSTRVYADE